MQFTASQLAILSLFLTVSTALPQQYQPEQPNKPSAASKIEASYSSAKGAYPTSGHDKGDKNGKDEGPNAYMSKVEAAMSAFDSKWAKFGAGYATPVHSCLTPGVTPTPGAYRIPKGAPKEYKSDIESLISQYEHALPTGSPYGPDSSSYSAGAPYAAGPPVAPGSGGYKSGASPGHHHKGEHTPSVHPYPHPTPGGFKPPHHHSENGGHPKGTGDSYGGPGKSMTTSTHHKASETGFTSPSRPEGGKYGSQPSDRKGSEYQSTQTQTAAPAQKTGDHKKGGEKKYGGASETDKSASKTESSSQQTGTY